MGCGSSKTKEDENPNVSVSMHPAGTHGEPVTKKKNTMRARRLSYIMEDADKEVSDLASHPTAEVEHAKVLDLNSPMRVRKLSYLLHDEHLQEVPQFAVAAATMTGVEPDYKKVNQDRLISIPDLTHGWSLFGVFDGHGAKGHECSEFVRLQLPGLLTELLTHHAPTKAVEVALQQLHEDLQQSGFDCRYSGTTAVVCLLKDKLLVTAWTGDSRAVLALEGNDGQLTATPLSFDHKPDLPNEKKRILKSGGRVQSMQEDGEDVGPARVWVKDRWSPGLAMSRSIGDTVAHSVGVSCIPEVRTHVVQPGDRFFIVASDGIWEFITDLEASQIIDESGSFQEGCNKLLMDAHNRWLRIENGQADDCCLIIVQVCPVSSKKNEIPLPSL